MAFPNYYGDDDPMQMYNMMRASRAGGGAPRRFDEYYRCYPTAMMPGPDRDYLNYGSKIIMPPSALDKLTRLHITYPMLFELVNGNKQRMTHAGVLEFVAEEGKLYLPSWMMQALLLESGDLIQCKSTDLPSARLVKLQPQSTDFLDISDPKAVLENAFRNFSTLTRGDVFSFHYNDTVYDVAVLEVRPESDKMGVCMIETDVEVDFAPPVGYVEPERGSVRRGGNGSGSGSGASTPGGAAGAGRAGLPSGGLLHSQGTMAQAINYGSIAPSAGTAAAGARAVSSNFLLGGQKLASKGRGASKAPTPKPSTPVAGASASSQPAPAAAVAPVRRTTNGPQPLRLPPNKLFFGYEVKPVKTQAEKDKENEGEARQPRFEGQGQTLRGGVGKKPAAGAADSAEKSTAPLEKKKADNTGRRLDGRKT